MGNTDQPAVSQGIPLGIATGLIQAEQFYCPACAGVLTSADVVIDAKPVKVLHCCGKAFLRPTTLAYEIDLVKAGAVIDADTGQPFSPLGRPRG